VTFGYLFFVFLIPVFVFSVTLCLSGERLTREAEKKMTEIPHSSWQINQKAAEIFRELCSATHRASTYL
jgi:hypothetical protein